MEAEKNEAPAGGSSATPPRIELSVHGDFVRVLDTLGLSLALSTRPTNVILLGAMNGELTVSHAMVSQPIGLATGGNRLAIATARSIAVFANVAKLAPHYPGKTDYFDAYFVPRMLLFTGQCSMHDMIFSQSGIIVGANTNFSCLCRVDGRYSFTPFWQPPFITELRAEDRCHLNGFTGENDELRYVTALSQANSQSGWRQSTYFEGVLIDAEKNAIMRSDLCMPHSPRLIGGNLYVLNGGMGEVLRVDRGTGRSAVMARLPGFTHGMCGHGNVLFVGLSQDRVSRMKGTPPVAERVKHLIAGVVALDIHSGTTLGGVEFNTAVTEVYDLRPLPGIRRPGIQSLVDSEGFVAVDTPNTAIWLKRAEDDPSALEDIMASDNYRIRITR